MARKLLLPRNVIWVLVLCLGGLTSCVLPAAGPATIATAPSTATAVPTVMPTTQPDAVVNVSALNVRSGPGVVYDRLSVVLEADELTVISQAYNCDWLRIITPDGDEGWVSAPYLILNVTCDTIALASIPPTPTLTVTVTSAATLLPADTPTDTPEPTATNTPEPALETATPQPVAGIFVDLLQPLEPELRGRQEFAWRANFELAPNQAFEMILWEPNQDPLRDGFSLTAATKASMVSVNLEDAIAAMPRLRASTNYKWGVLLVELTPYRRLQFLQNEHAFRLEHANVVATLVPADTPTNTPAAPPTRPTLVPADTLIPTPTATPKR